MPETRRLRNPTAYRPQQAKEEACLPASMANYPFRYVHYPHGWEWTLEHGFLPTLCSLVHRPGVNGVGTNGTGRNAKIVPDKAHAAATRNGGRIVEPNDPRLGEYRDYLTFFPTENGGRHFCFMASEATVLSNGMLRMHDCSAEWDAFRAHVRDSGIIEPMEEVVYNDLMELERGRLDRITRRVHDGRAQVGADKAQRERMDAMQKAWAAYAEKHSGRVVTPEPVSESASPEAGKRVRARKPTADEEAAVNG